MYMKAIDWSNIYKKYKGLWVALKSDEITVITAGKDAKKVWQEAKKKYPEPILTKMPNKLVTYVGFGA
jgi:hypothetical protein